MDHAIMIVTITVMVICGAIICVVWWKWADKLYPGTDKKTGQKIELFKAREGPKGPPPRVIKAFDRPAPHDGQGPAA